MLSTASVQGKIKILEKNGIGHRQTSSAYLKKLATAGILRAVKVGKELFFITDQLMVTIIQ